MLTEFAPELCIDQKICNSWTTFMNNNAVYSQDQWWYILVLFGLITGLRVIAGMVLYQKTKSFGQ